MVVQAAGSDEALSGYRMAVLPVGTVKTTGFYSGSV